MNEITKMKEREKDRERDRERKGDRTRKREALSLGIIFDESRKKRRNGTEIEWLC